VSSKPRSPLLPIFLIVLVDVLGFTIVIPLLSLYAEKFGASPLVATTIVSCYAICSFVSTPMIGRLSDQYGRKKLLLLSQAGTCAGFLMLGTSTALWMVFVGRILDGITAGNLSVAQAYISDHTAPENRAKAFGVIGVAFGIGFMFGPALGGVLGQHSMHLPFIVAAGMSALSMVCTYFLLDNQLPPQAAGAAAAAPAAAKLPEARAGKPTSGGGGPAGRRPGAFDFSIYAEYFRRPGLATLYAQFIVYIFGFSCFTSGFALFAERRFGWSAKETGWMFAYAGLLGIILQGGLIGRLVKKLGEVRLVLIGTASGVVAYILLGLSETIALLLVAATINSFGNGVLRPVLTSQISQAVGRHEQGVALGISGSLSSLAMAFAPPAGGFMIDHGWLIAWTIIPATMSLFGLLLASASKKPPKISPATGAAAAPPKDGAAGGE
jgi:MFS family permease